MHVGWVGGDGATLASIHDGNRGCRGPTGEAARGLEDNQASEKPERFYEDNERKACRRIDATIPRTPLGRRRMSEAPRGFALRERMDKR